MSDFEDLDDVVGALRSPATPSELSGETGMVDLMASHHRATKGSTMFTSRRSRVAVLIAAGVIGFGGVAAAGSGGFDLLDSQPEVADSTTTSTTSTSTSTTSTTSTTSVPETTSTTSIETETETETEIETESETADVEDVVVYGVDADPDPNTEFNEAYCLDGNHGKTVSAVARGEAPFEGIDPSVAAQSSCGKDDDEDEAVDDDSDDESIDDDADEVEIDDERDESDHDDDRGQEHAGKGKGNGGENKSAENRGGKDKSGKDD
jgi:hypothetical protein